MRPLHRPGRRTARFVLTSAIFGAVPVLTAAAAVQRSYTGPNNGMWGTASNWTPAGVPANGDTAVIAPKTNTGITVVYQSTYSAPGIAQLTIDAPGAGGVVLSEATGTNPALVAGSEFIGLAQEGAGTAQFTQRLGVNQVTGKLAVGEGAKSRGLYLLSGGTNSAASLILGDADPSSSGTYKLSGSAFLQISGNETIGHQGSGTFSQSGGQNTVMGMLLLADQASGKASYTMTAGSVSSAGQIFGPGTATFTQLGGSNSAGGLSISAGANGSALYTLSGGSLTAGSETIGANGSLVQGPGTSQTIGQAFMVGDGTGGTLTVNGGKLFGHELTMAGGGAFTIAGGTVNTTTETLGVGVGKASITQTGGLNFVDNTLTFGTVSGGQGGYVFSGGTLTVGGALVLAKATNSSGNISMGAGATLNANSETIGQQGLGTFTQTGGSNTVTDALQLAPQAGGDGIYFMSAGTTSAASLANNGTFAQTGGGVTVGPVTGAGTLSVGGGPSPTTFSTPSFTQNRVGVSQNATLTVAHSASPQTNVASILTVSGGGKLDLANNNLMVTYGTNPSPAADIAADLASGYDAGKWDGPGIATSAADASHGLGFADGADNVVKGLDPTTLLVKFTRYGDANLDGAVNFDDLLLLAQHYGATASRWDQGDFNYDGQVNFSDLLLLAQNYGQGSGAAGAALAAVPEPASLAAVGLLACFLPRRRRR